MKEGGGRGRARKYPSTSTSLLLSVNTSSLSAQGCTLLSVQGFTLFVKLDSNFLLLSISGEGVLRFRVEFVGELKLDVVLFVVRGEGGIGS